MRVIADFHVHSRFSRACSKDLTLPNIAAACAVRGIDLVVTGDFTHPAWRKEIGEQLQEAEDGIFQLQLPAPSFPAPSHRVPSHDWDDWGQLQAGGVAHRATQFLLGTELSCIYKHDGKTRRVHHLVIMPSLAAVDALTKQLVDRGCNLRADGRPILGVTSHDLLAMCLEADERALVIPAHAWTPWFAIFGSQSGYDSIEECFGDLASHVYAIETGLSSDPPMNWRVSALDRVALVSSSDAHSLQKLGREATVLELEAITFSHLVHAIRSSALCRYDARARNRILSTIEFFPEEGKYHADGHRACVFRCSPAETKSRHGICPQCAKLLTIGVQHRVDNLADRPEGYAPACAPTFRSIVPLVEVIMEAYEVKSLTKRVRETYTMMTHSLGSEFSILLDVPMPNIVRVAPREVAEAIRRVRSGALHIEPGYDGEFGTIRIFTEDAPRPVTSQVKLFH